MATLTVARSNRRKRAAISAVAPSNTPTYTLEMVDPETAQTWLGYNTHNRNVNQRTVAAYARDMAAGNWVVRGDAVEFTENPCTLVNGQHRLHAVVASGATVPLLVGRGVSMAAQNVADSGRKRSFADQLSLKGETQPTLLASIVRRGLMWDRGIVGNAGGAYTPTLSEMADWLAGNEDAHVAAEYAEACRRNIGLQGSIGGLAFLVTNRIDPAQAHEFMSRLADGASLPHGHPILALRKRVIETNALSGRIPETEVLALVFITWNHFRSGSSITKLQLPKGGLTSKNFPMPR